MHVNVHIGWCSPWLVTVCVGAEGEMVFFFSFHTPVRFSEVCQSGSNSLYSDCAGLPLVKCREHIRELRSDAESLRPIAFPSSL